MALDYRVSCYEHFNVVGSCAEMKTARSF